MILKDLLDRAISIESRETYGKENLDISQAGTIAVGNRLYDLYTDSDGTAWYSVRIMKDGEPVSEYEAIFGKRRKRR